MMELPRFSGHLIIERIVVGAVEAVGNGEGAPFSKVCGKVRGGGEVCRCRFEPLLRSTSPRVPPFTMSHPIASGFPRARAVIPDDLRRG